MTDQEMMLSIKTQMGQTIRATCGVGMEAFVAALVANESSGDPEVSRFEPGVMASMAEVLAERKPNFGSITGKILMPMLSSAALRFGGMRAAVSLLMDLATSWGPTQIMGYQTIGMLISIDDLKTAGEKHFQLCGSILKAFIQEWHLAGADWESLFRCWNTGRATGETTDPAYVAKGLSRMAIYEGLG
jgi:hypothetical protein